MTACISCSADAPGGARYCPSCGSPLAAPAVATERKVVTTLFADLVSYTSVCERYDPEDVDKSLRAFFDAARTAIERFGGTVEKFIGDAVVGAFGVPKTHEDDAERGVRAGLAIVEAVDGLPSLANDRLEVRVGVNTGLALVRLRVVPSSGEGFLVGDSVNTAARLLTEAPPMGVVVGRATHRLTSRAILFEELPPFAAKGKAAAVPRWLARGVIARRGADFHRLATTTMVGREVEMAVLSGLLDKARVSSSPQFALLVGEAGIGKSRLIHEFGKEIDRRPGFLCTWRQGSCPPYGDGRAFRALSDIVMAHAGILETDDDVVVERKLAGASGMAACEPVVLDRLRPLVGLPAPQVERSRSFDAWVRYVEAVVAVRPAVLVIEDVQHASDQTLAFLGHLVRSIGDVPLLLICSARPEFLDAHPWLPDYSDVVVRIDLKSLTPREVSRLLGDLVPNEAGPEQREPILQRCGGNPLYAEELARYVTTVGGREGPATDAMPDSLLALMAARLDVLPPAHRATLADASVLGIVFPTDGVLAMTDDPGRASAVLADLTEREFLRRRSPPEQGDKGDLEFWHALTQQVVYERMPRTARAVKHARAAAWIDSIASSGARRAVQELARHYPIALELARLSGESALAADLVEPAVRSLLTAGDQALSLDITAAEGYYGRALALAGPEHPRRVDLLLAWGETLNNVARFTEAVDVLQEAALRLRAAGDGPGAAFALRRAAFVKRNATGHDDTAMQQEAALLDDKEPSPRLARALEERAFWAAWKAPELSISLADQAIEMCRQLGADEPVDALQYRGTCRAQLGDRGGLDDIRKAIKLLEARADEAGLCKCYFNLAEMLGVYEGPAAALAVRRKGLASALSRRDTWAIGFSREGQVHDLCWCGAWETALAEGEEVDAYLAAQDRHYDLQRLRATIALLRTWRGSPKAARPPAIWAEEASRTTDEPGARAASVLGLAIVSEALHDEATALSLLDEAARLPDADRLHPDYVFRLPAALRSAFAMDAGEIAQRLAAGLPADRAWDACVRLTLAAMVAERGTAAKDAAASWADAAHAWHVLGVRFEEGLALLGQGRCGPKTAYGKAALSEARAIFGSLGAVAALAELESVAPTA